MEKPKDQSGFQLLPKRRVVERTFAWLVRQRRLARNYERLPETSAAVIYTAMIKLMLRRLASEYLFRHFLRTNQSISLATDDHCKIRRQLHLKTEMSNSDHYT